MEDLYPLGPLNVPAELRQPSARYKRHAWLAVAALVAFVAIYLGLTIWFVVSAYRSFSAMGSGGDEFYRLLSGSAMTFLSVFMIKGLFFVKRSEETKNIELKTDDQPDLFAFLHRIADDAGAPRPHRVFLSMRVNAGVFYDLSIANLLFPSKKNLEIGLGLVNTLSLTEFKAVLAHEFGHFAQRTMAVGRWVYVAQRVASNIIAKRDALDRLLMWLSGIDFRMAWVGWLMRLVVWSLRAVLDAVFTLVILAERALSREMEFQADLVSVSLTGSDALIHALHKLGAADSALDESLRILTAQYGRGHEVSDVFVIQTRVLEHMRTVLADESFGATPPPAAGNPGEHRVFLKRMADAPKMWSTHPPNRDREDNAKRVYLPVDLDARPAWCLFREATRLRTHVTRTVFTLLGTPKEPPKALSETETLAAVDSFFMRIVFDPRYRGAYLGRSSVRHTRTAEGLYLPLDAPCPSITQLYPPELRDALTTLESLESEHNMLLGLKRGLLKANGQAILFRGDVIRRQDLSRVLDQVERERDRARTVMSQFDAQHRSAHLAEAVRLGHGWPEYLRSLTALLHYADHTEANLHDASGHLANVFSIAIADGRVSRGERKRLVSACAEVHTALEQAFEQRTQVRLPDSMLEYLKVERWRDVLPNSFDLLLPTPDNIANWLDAVDSWLDGFIPAFQMLERMSLEALLMAEEKVARMARGELPVEDAPVAPRVPTKYRALLPGQERERQWQLGLWDRFQVAEGFFPSLARFSVAGTVMVATLALSAKSYSPQTVRSETFEPARASVATKPARVEPRTDTPRQAPITAQDVYDLAQRGAWNEMLAALDIAQKSGNLPQQTAVDVGRLARFAGEPTVLEKIAKGSRPLTELLALELGQFPNGERIQQASLTAYAKLAEGNLKGAADQGIDDPLHGPRLTRLIGASRGATRQQIDAALALEETVGIDADTLLPSVALLLRERRDAKALLTRVPEFFDRDEQEVLVRFFEPAALLKESGTADTLTSKLTPRSRGLAYTTAVVILGEKAPTLWLIGARKLLFSYERPFL